MKKIQIPLSKYNDKEFLYNYLNGNKTIGDEDPDYNGIFHVHWRGPIDNDKILIQIKSILATQDVQKIYFWIEDPLITMSSPGYAQIARFKEVEFKVFDKEEFWNVKGTLKAKEKVWQYYTMQTGDKRYKTDILRFIVLSIYGGVYSDLDLLYLRNVKDIKLNNWSSKWATDPYAECCILKLEQGSDIWEEIYNNNPNDKNCFSMFKPGHNANLAFDWEYDNLSFYSLPSPFFDMIWGMGSQNRDMPFLPFHTFDQFFEKSEKDFSLETFLPGCFAYHWHNRWDKPIHPQSPMAKLNRSLDETLSL